MTLKEIYQKIRNHVRILHEEGSVHAAECRIAGFG